VSYALNNVTTTDGYTDAATLRCPGTTRLLIHTRNAAIGYQLGRGRPASVWQDEVMMLPGTASLIRACDAIRVRSWTAGKPAQVIVDATGPGDG
jgi:hypothetical protein